tara:strand:+ start:286 stop:435 length:150 start_codon:yes stop_codon:yes gene_type:complete
MYWWNPKNIKELKEKGYKLKLYNYDPRLKDQTIEEIEDQDQVNTEDTQK